LPILDHRISTTYNSEQAQHEPTDAPAAAPPRHRALTHSPHAPTIRAPKRAPAQCRPPHIIPGPPVITASIATGRVETINKTSAQPPSNIHSPPLLPHNTHVIVTRHVVTMLLHPSADARLQVIPDEHRTEPRAVANPEEDVLCTVLCR
jgi:hypothetical protein